MANERYNEVSNRLISTRASVDDPKVNLIVTGADSVYDDVAPYRVNGHIECNAVTPTGTENPKELRWYEQVTYGTGQDAVTEWVRSNDDTVTSGKTYGIPTGAKQSDINDQLYEMTGDIDKVVLYANEYEEITNPPSGANPQANGWYEESGGVYTPTTDTEVNPQHTYYARVAHISPDENNIIEQKDGYVPTAGAVGRALGANFEDNLLSTSTVKGLTANMGRVLNETKANKNGWYEQLVAGASLSVIGDDVDNKAKFFYRETGDSETSGETGGSKHTIEKGTATFNEIRGNTVKFNQLHPSNESSRVVQGVTEVLENGVYTLNGTLDATYLQLQLFSNTIGKHYLHLSVLSDPNNILEDRFLSMLNRGALARFLIKNGVVKTIYNNDSTQSALGRTMGFAGTTENPLPSGTVFSNVKVSLIDIDLTAIFGSGNEPSLDDFEIWLTQNVGYQDYYPYNAGSLISLKPKKLISTGFNQWDEEWEIGSFDGSGLPSTSTTRIRSKNFCPIVGGQTYNLYYGDFISLYDKCIALYYYNKNQEFINYTAQDVQNKQVVAPLDACYFKIRTGGSASVTTYSNNININLTSTLNGTYKPYIRTTEVDLSWIMDIPDPEDNTKKLFPYGLLQVGSVKDEITTTKAIKRVGAVDLGSLSWSYRNDYSAFETAANTLKELNAPRNNSIIAVALCSQYNLKTFNQMLTTSGSSVAASDDRKCGHKNILYNASSLNNGHASWLEGVIFYYELATPITVTFEEPDTHPMNYEVESGGTEEFVKADAALGETEPTSTSLTATIIYPMDTLQTIRNLETTTLTKAAYIASANSLVSAINDMGLGYTLAFNETYLTFSSSATVNTQSVENNETI